jgi:hypothetical protein
MCGARADRLTEVRKAGLRSVETPVLLNRWYDERSPRAAGWPGSNLRELVDLYVAAALEGGDLATLGPLQPDPPPVEVGTAAASLTAVGPDHAATAVWLVTGSSSSTGVSLPMARWRRRRL